MGCPRGFPFVLFNALFVPCVSGADFLLRAPAKLTCLVPTQIYPACTLQTLSALRHLSFLSVLAVTLVRFLRSLPTRLSVRLLGKGLVQLVGLLLGEYMHFASRSARS